MKLFSFLFFYRLYRETQPTLFADPMEKLSLKDNFKTIPILLYLFFVFPSFTLPSPPLQLPYSGAGVASLKDDFSFQLNPALLGFQEKSEFLISYGLNGKDQKGLLAIQDKQGGLPLGLSYERIWKNEGEPENTWGVFVGQRFSSYLSFGFSVHKDQLDPPWNANIGVLFKSGIKTALGLVLNNLTISRPYNKREKFFTFGVYQGFGDFFSVRADALHLKKQGWIFKGGFENLFYDFLALRLGGLWNAKEKEGMISGGLGFHGPRLQIEYGMQKKNNRRIQTHAFSAKLIF